MAGRARGQGSGPGRHLGSGLIKPMVFLNPRGLGRELSFPPLGLLKAEAFELAEVIALKRAASVPIHVVFPVKEAQEAANLEKLCVLLEPLHPLLFDQGWLALGGDEPGALLELTRHRPWLKLFQARQFPSPDQPPQIRGKGAVMRALLYHLVQSGEVTDDRTIIQFIDADIVPSYFGSHWLAGPVGAILWFKQVEAAKIVYFRPQGGRLNAFLRSLLATIPHSAIKPLQTLVYLLSGEMAGTLRFWTAVPFKAGYGVEVMILLALALRQVQLHPDIPALEQVAQVFVGQMDHRHAPLVSSGSLPGLDQMAGNVFLTLFEALRCNGLLSWSQTVAGSPHLTIPTMGSGPAASPEWLQVALGEHTFPPLGDLPEIAAVLNPTGNRVFQRGPQNCGDDS